MCADCERAATQAGASIICTKHKEKTSMQTLRSLLYHHVFHTPIDGRLLQLDHGRPLLVPASADSFAGIGKPPQVEGCLSDLTADKWCAAYTVMFPPKETKREALDLSMVEAEQFAEEAIDELRRQKRDELKKTRQASEFEAKMADAAGNQDN